MMNNQLFEETIPYVQFAQRWVRGLRGKVFRYGEVKEVGILNSECNQYFGDAAIVKLDLQISYEGDRSEFITYELEVSNEGDGGYKITEESVIKPILTLQQILGKLGLNNIEQFERFLSREIPESLGFDVGEIDLDLGFMNLIRYKVDPRRAGQNVRKFERYGKAIDVLLNAIHYSQKQIVAISSASNLKSIVIARQAKIYCEQLGLNSANNIFILQELENEPLSIF